MNWFEKHLNWTIVLSFFCYCLIALLIINLSPGKGSVFGSINDLPYLIGVWAAFTAISSILITMQNLHFMGYFLIPTTLFLIVCGWVLKRKKRSLALLFFPILIPLGWILPLWLNNRHE